MCVSLGVPIFEYAHNIFIHVHKNASSNLSTSSYLYLLQ